MASFGPVLGIETSCDETAAAVVARSQSGKPEILSNVVLSQIEEHSRFGGVVPEIAARAHLSAIEHIVEEALSVARVQPRELAGVSATAGPGLVGGLIVGLMTAKGLAAATHIPFLAINHLEGHALTPRLTDQVPFPYMLLLVSGGHSQILRIEGLGKYNRLASTIDDAVGETFDKTAKLLGLGFPGGPSVEKAALKGNADRFRLPKPLKGKDTLNMSFSGLKTAIRQEATALAPLSENDVSDLCASMQKTISEVLVDRCRKVLETKGNDINALVVAGGVAANQVIREGLESVAKDAGIRLIAPPLKLCTDNAAMIAWAGLERFERGESSDLSVSPRSRWPLDETSQTMLGSGKKGAKV